MGEMVIAAYRPRPGKADELLELVRGHVPALRGQGLATGRAPTVLRAGDGTLLELFEWVSATAADEAHGNPVVRALWSRFEEVCEFVALDALPEARRPFPHFEPVDP